MKIRIIKKNTNNYIAQYKFLFWWWTECTDFFDKSIPKVFYSKTEAIEHMKNKYRKREKKSFEVVAKLEI